jgi:hypothetical protein
VEVGTPIVVEVLNKIEAAIGTTEVQESTNEVVLNMVEGIKMLEA